VLGLFCATLMPGAHADGNQSVEKVEVYGHYETGVGTSDAASAGSITPELIDDRPLLRPAEVLEEIPGMIVTQHSGAGKANQYFLRGFNLDHGTDFATSVTGMPANMRTNAHGQGYMDLNFLIPELVERVDYYKGPYSAQQGDFATAGSAEIHYADSLRNSVAELTGGTDRYGRILLAGSPQVGPGRVVYGLELYHDDGPWEHPDNYRKYNAVFRYTQGLADGRVGITAMGYSGIWNSTDQIPQRAVDEGLIGRFGAIDPSDGGRSYRYSLSSDYATSLAGGHLQANAYAIRYYLTLWSNFTYYLHDPVDGDQINQYDNRSILGLNGSWGRPDEIFGLQMQNGFGWDLRQDRIGPLGLYNTVKRVRRSVVREDRVRETSYALWFENRTRWTDWLRTIAGIRGDRYVFSVESDLAVNSGSTGAALASPKLSVVAGPWQQTEWFLNLGEGYHSNDARGTTTHVDPGTGEPVNPVTPLVRAKGAEIGVRTELVPHLQSSLAIWYLHLDSELVFEGDTGTSVPSRPSKRTGIEWSNHYVPLRWLLLDLDLAYTRPRFTSSDSSGSYIPEALEATAAGGTTLREVGPWTASLFGRYFGPRPLTEDNSVRSKSTTLFNAQVTYRASENVRLRFDVFNVFNREADDITYYYVSRLPGEPPAGVADNHFHPAESRTFRLGAIMAL
jgi:outer membrane receptor protein involved in Fe transport